MLTYQSFHSGAPKGNLEDILYSRCHHGNSLLSFPLWIRIQPYLVWPQFNQIKRIKQSNVHCVTVTVSSFISGEMDVHFKWDKFYPNIWHLPIKCTLFSWKSEKSTGEGLKMRKDWDKPRGASHPNPFSSIPLFCNHVHVYEVKTRPTLREKAN